MMKIPQGNIAGNRDISARLEHNQPSSILFGINASRFKAGEQRQTLQPGLDILVEYRTR
jgi:hypothetical protein